MSTVFESIMKGLTEAVEDRRRETKEPEKQIDWEQWVKGLDMFTDDYMADGRVENSEP